MSPSVVASCWKQCCMNGCCWTAGCCDIGEITPKRSCTSVARSTTGSDVDMARLARVAGADYMSVV